MKGGATVEPTEKVILTIKETAREYKPRGVAEFAIRNWAKQGLFPTLQAGNRVYINRAVFEEFLAKGGKVDAIK
jgi:hypothetical protein